ncbi:MAG: serine/threonine-protein phosphatase [Chromatiales bacterium]|nr:MAG: serine/threonine-protein phosphatase [Chromatiales bacterium]
MQIEHAELSLIGDRSENQDRVLVVAEQGATLLICVDGMGGHSDGAKAAEVASQTIAQAFSRSAKPVFDPQGFLHLAIGRAHTNLVAIGAEQSMDTRPRATCAVCLVQDGAAYWAHVGDSRIYLLRGARVLERTRDHSHVELLLREGLISEAEIADHPMRNFVECCLGGDPRLPGMSITGQKTLAAGDMLLACTDGLWSGLGDEEIGATLGSGDELYDGLRMLGQQAVEACGPYADNTSAVAVRVGNGKAAP